MRVKGHVGPVYALEWSPRDEFILASGGQDGVIRVWDVRKARSCLAELSLTGSADGGKAHFDSILGLTFASNGLSLVSASKDKTLRLWDVLELKYSHKQVPWEAASHYSSIRPLLTDLRDCSPPLLYIPSHRHILEVNMRTFTVRKRLQGHFGRVTCLAMNAAEPSLYSGGADREILSWKPMWRAPIVP
jgi:DNA excision repair protein ERCC-8